MLKKIVCIICFVAVIQGICAGNKYDASGTSSPSPLYLAGRGAITIKPAVDLGDDVYIFSWCGIYAGKTGFSMTWDGAINEKYRMSRNSDGSYSYQLTQSYQDWFKLSDEQCADLKEIGVIARNLTDQTVNVYIECTYQEEFFSGGTGSVNDPYQIQCDYDLEYLSSNTKFWADNTYFVQTAPIKLEQPLMPVGNEKYPFKGCYDGDGYSIAGLNVKCNAGSAAGFFGVAEGADIKRVVLTDCEINGAGYVGALVGLAKDCRITESISSEGEVHSLLLAAGGLVGSLEGGTISDCYSSTDVVADAQKAVGGLVGKNTGEIINSYATGRVSASNYAGGLVGANYGTVKNSAAINKSIEAAGKFVGRFGGNNNHQNISEGNFAWNDIPHQQPEAWSDFSDHAARPELTPTEQSTFDNALQWDFNNVWYWRRMDEGGYPELRMAKDQLPSPMPQISSTIAIQTAESYDSDVERIYNLHGIYMGNSVDKLPAGIYIVKNNNGVYKIIH